MTPQELQSTSERLHKRLNEDPVLTFPAIQYFLSETGHASARIDPRQLRASLKILANNPAPGDDLGHGPWEPVPEIYVAPHLTRTGARKHAKVVAGTAEEVLRKVSDGTSNRAIPLAEAITDLLSIRSEVHEVDVGVRESLAGDIDWSAAGAKIEIDGTDKCPPLSIWVTNNLEWVFPDAFRLWRHLITSEANGAYPVIVGRKLPVATFTLLKRIGGFGLQLHHLYMEVGAADLGASGKAFAHGPPTMHPDEVQEHRAVHEYLRKVIRRPPPQGADERTAIRLAAQLGLHLKESGGLPGLRQWLNETKLQLPVPWKAQLTRYERWKRVSENQ